MNEQVFQLKVRWEKNAPGWTCKIVGERRNKATAAHAWPGANSTWWWQLADTTAFCAVAQGPHPDEFEARSAAEAAVVRHYTPKPKPMGGA